MTDTEMVRERGIAALKEQYDVIEKRNAAAMERQSKSKPTPTQAECDLARLGLLAMDDPKEDHGGEDESEARERDLRERADDEKRARETRDRAMAAARPAGYQTRANAPARKPPQ